MNEIITGFLMGSSNIIIGHPFDTIKVLIQNKRKWYGFPIKNYYNGWKYPLLFSSIFYCTSFPLVEKTNLYTTNYWLPRPEGRLFFSHISPASVHDYIMTI